MFTTVESAYFIIWAIIIGIIAAMFISNRQRRILSKFINALTSSEAFSEESSKSLSELGLTVVEEKYILKAISSQFGLKRIIARCNYDDKTKYYVTNKENEDLSKKYSYSAPSKKNIIFLIILLAIVGVLASVFAKWLGNITLFHNNKNEIVQETDNKEGSNLPENEIRSATENDVEADNVTDKADAGNDTVAADGVTTNNSNENLTEKDLQE